MSVIRVNPTSAGRRAVVKLDKSFLHKGPSYAPLLSVGSKRNGRSSSGQITMRHRGGGTCSKYRIVDFLRKKDGVEAIVERIEYDPNRSAFLALICYLDGSRSYILAPEKIKVGDKVENGVTAPIKIGNCLPLSSIPVGSVIHAVELQISGGAKLVRSAGASAVLLGKESEYAQVRLKSGEVRRVHVNCRAVIGSVSNAAHSLVSLGKAGANRWKGIRPTVRGVAMNPVDHPHGGGEGKTGEGRHPVSPWGQLTKGFRTRKNKRTGSMIMQKRYN
jgi:large subunit ribosomal protein L2